MVDKQPQAARRSAEDLEGETVGGWTLSERIGEGASAVVYRSERDNVDYAVKVYKPEILERFGKKQQTQRIERQLKLVRARHPHLIEIYEGAECQTTGLWYLVMQFLAHPPLDRHRVPPGRIRPILAQVAEAARFLESHHIAHRDIKPANIVISPDFRRATLLDLGVIKPIEGLNYTDGTNRRPFVATTRYSPPELLTREESPDLEGWTAVTFYQLGAVLYSMITHRIMFADVPDEPYAGLIKAVENDPPRLTRDEIAALGEDGHHLVALMEDCLAKDPQRRLETVTWERFECVRRARRPTVVLLYAGGTIGASTDWLRPERKLRQVDSRYHPLLQAVGSRILRNYAQILRQEQDFPFDLEWEILPPEQQILSENASPQSWNDICAALERLFHKYVHGPAAWRDAQGDEPLSEDDQMRAFYEEDRRQAEVAGRAALSEEEYVRALSNRYIAGVILMHGTDTLAFSATAVTVGMQHLPCPVVLTGSNQPPAEDTIGERNIIQSRSDAWRNIVTSVYFLHCYGHRYTELFVCFNETVFHGVNLRKSAIERIPLKFDPHIVALEEPYTFRNVALRRQYMFRLIDGLFCNNFYPISSEKNYRALIQESEKDFRHVRKSVRRSRHVASADRFSRGGVQLVDVSPSTQSWEEMPPPDPGLRVVLLNGYDSGTFPTNPGHPFVRQLEAWAAACVPLVLISRYGLVATEAQYETEKVCGRPLPILRLYGVIAETALPMLSVIVNRIDRAEWNEEHHDGDLLEHRHGLLNRAIAKYLHSRPNILTLVLGKNIMDVGEQREMISEHIHNEERVHKEITTQLFTSAKTRLQQVAAPSARSEGQQRASFGPETHYLREYFVWHLLELARPFEYAGCGPDAFRTLYETGFTWGTRHYELLAESQPDRKNRDWLFDEQDEETASGMIERTQQLALSIARILFGSGIADVACEDFRLERDAPKDGSGASASTLSMEISVRRHHRMLREDELYSVQHLDDDEEAFFHKLQRGAALEESVAEFEEGLERSLSYLVTKTWDYRVSALDWFTLGAFKAVMCQVLRDLLLDPWVDECNSDQPRHVDALRQSIRTRILRGGKRELRFQLRYRTRHLFGPNDFQIVPDSLE